MLRKNEVKVSENGRSMVEMIGVLAVIMVLSMIGIFMFAKGMAKQKSNKVLNQVSMIQHNLNELYANNRTFKGLGASAAEATQNAYELGIFPEDTTKTCNGGYSAGCVQHAWGGAITLEPVEDNGVANQAVEIVLEDLSDEAAISISTAQWSVNNISVNGN